MTGRPRFHGLFAVCLVLVVLPASARAEWHEKVLYSFQGNSDGAVPAGGVIFGKDGSLYGATQQGGASNCKPFSFCGTLYQLKPPAKLGDPWTETVLHVFKGNTGNDGAYPQGGLIADPAGNLYGTTGYGGIGQCTVLGVQGGCGTVFQLSPPKEAGGKWTETLLYSFQGGKDGWVPVGDLVFDKAGNLYGATYFGGGKGNTCNPYYQYCGTVFELSPPKTKGGKWTEKVLHSFAGGEPGKKFGDGANPNGGLVLDSQGTLYGTTYFGGNDAGECNSGVGGLGCGTIFELVPPIGPLKNWTEKMLYRFGGYADASNPAAGVVFDTKGNLYGATFFGPQGFLGTVFDLARPTGKDQSWTETILHRFTNRNDGASPSAAVVFDAHGNLYGTTAVATNRNAQGNVFRMKPSTPQTAMWTFGILYTFTGSPDGAYPAANLIVGKDDSFLSTTREGGTGQDCQGGCGTVFEVKP